MHVSPGDLIQAYNRILVNSNANTVGDDASTVTTQIINTTPNGDKAEEFSRLKLSLNTRDDPTRKK